MKVLLKSLEELVEEYGEDEIGRIGFMLGRKFTEFCSLMGNLHEARYDEKSDSYVIGDWHFHPNLIKGIVIGYTIKRLSDGKKCTFSL